MDGKFIWENLPIQTKTALRKFIESGALGGAGVRVLLVDAQGDVVTSLGGGGGGGGGMSTYSTAQGDITTAIVPGSRTFNITPLRFPVTISEDHIISGSFCKRQTLGNIVSDIDLEELSVAGNLVTLGENNEVFATGDAVYLKLEGPPKHDDADLDTEKVSVEDPDYGHMTDSEHLDDDNIGATGATATYERSLISGVSFIHNSCTYLLTADDTGNTVTLKVYGCNNPGISLPAATVPIVTADGIPNISEALLGSSAGIEVNGTSVCDYFVADEALQFDNFVIERKYLTVTAGVVGNAADLFIRKYY